MINAVFYKQNGVYKGFSVSGHAGFADFGQDIVCASVTSALQCTANGITEILKVDADVVVLDNEIKLSLPDGDNSCAVAFLQAFYMHLKLLSEDYHGTIKLTISEV